MSAPICKLSPQRVALIRRNIKHPSKTLKERNNTAAESDLWCNTKLFCGGDELCSKVYRRSHPTLASVSRDFISWGLKSLSFSKEKYKSVSTSEENIINDTDTDTDTDTIISNKEDKDRLINSRNDDQFSPLLDGFDPKNNKWADLLVSFELLSERFDEVLNVTDETIKNYISKVSKSRTITETVWSYYHFQNKHWQFTEPVLDSEEPETSDYEKIYGYSYNYDLEPQSFYYDQMLIQNDMDYLESVGQSEAAIDVLIISLTPIVVIMVGSTEEVMIDQF